MEIGIDLNEDNQVLLFYFNENDGLRVKIPEEVLEGINQGYLYKYIDGEFIRDTQQEIIIQNLIEIENLKQKLAETDYIVTKSMEYKLTAKPIPDDYNQILFDRDLWRNRINILQSEMEELKEEN